MIVVGRKDSDPAEAVRAVKEAETALLNAEAAERLLHLETLRCVANYRDAVRELMGVKVAGVGAGGS